LDNFTLSTFFTGQRPKGGGSFPPNFRHTCMGELCPNYNNMRNPFFNCERQRLLNVTAHWLESFKWDYFITFTTRFESSPDQLRGMMDAFNKKVHKLQAERQQFNELSRLCYFSEDNKQRDGVHAHALIESSLSIKDLFKIWQLVTGNKHCRSDKNNYIRVLDYYPELGASFYITKYLTKNYIDWDLFTVGTEIREKQYKTYDVKRSVETKKNFYITDIKHENGVLQIHEELVDI